MRTLALTASLCLQFLLATCHASAEASGFRFSPAELQDWAAQHVGRPLARGGASSAALVITRSDEVLLEQAWGVADFRRGKLASPADTRFRVSSITKVFTAVAIAQLLERGQIASLHDPANRYLDRFRLPDNQGVEITLDHLLTHSAGFDMLRYGIWRHPGQSAAADRLSGGEISQWLPEYVRPAGRWAVYSNFGGALLALVVEDVTGMALGEYFREEIFTPLGMHNTALVAEPSEALAQSYFRTPHKITGRLKLQAYSPLMQLSMGLESTAADMGRFLGMMLQGGQSGEGRILGAETVRELLRERFSNHPAANGFGMIFDVVRQTPEITLYMHNGSTGGFSSHILLVPGRDLAAFIAVAGEPAPAGPAGEDAPIAERLVGTGISGPLVIAKLVRDMVSPYRYTLDDPPLGRESELQGTYVTERRSRASAEALFDLLYPPMQVAVEASEGGYRGNGIAAREVSGNVFMPDGPWAYREMFSWEGGKPVMVIYGSTILRRLHDWWTPAARKSLLQVLVIFLLAGSWMYFLCSVDLPQRLFRTLLLLQWPLLLAYPLYLVIQPAGEIVLRVQQMDRSPLIFACLLAHGIALLAFALGCACWRAWHENWWGRGAVALGARIQLLAMCLAAGGLCWVLWSLNLIGGFR